MKAWVGTILILVLVIGATMLPKEVSFTLETSGKIMPLREWILFQTNEGSLSASLRDHLRGTVESYTVNQFERGDATRFTLNAGLAGRRFVAEGDTIGTIYSNEVDYRLTELAGELASRKASIKILESGEKPALLEEARQTVVRAETRVTEHALVIERLRSLYTQNLISDQEMEAAESQQEIYIADVAIARAQLRARQTGARQEEIDLIETEIEGLQRSIEALERRLRYQTITAPLSGFTARTFASDTLFTLRDTTGYVLLVPVEWSKVRHITSSSTIEIRLPGNDLQLKGTIRHIGDRVYQLDGRQVVPVVGVVKGFYPTLLPGIVAKTTIHGERLTLFEYIKGVLD